MKNATDIRERTNKDPWQDIQEKDSKILMHF